MTIVSQKVALKKLLNQNKVWILICSFISKLSWDALMKLSDNLKPNLRSTNSSLFYVDWFYLTIDALKELLPYRFDESDILQKNFMKLSVLVIVILLVVRLDLYFTPLRESYPF